MPLYGLPWVNRLLSGEWGEGTFRFPHAGIVKFPRTYMKPLQRFFPLSLIAVLAGCASFASVDPKIDKSAEASSGQETRPGSQAPASLDPDVVFNVLAGEVAARRKDFALAFIHLYRAALLSRDVTLAEKAARLGAYAEDDGQALAAAEFWVSLEPDSLPARQLAVLYLVRQGEAEQALAQMREIVSISEEQGEDGFLHVLAALSRWSQHLLAVELMQRLAADYPEDPRARYATALLALMVKQTDTALNEARLLRDARPRFGRVYPLIARIYLSQGDRPAARSELEAGLNILPEDTLILSTYARLLVEMSDYEEAYRQFSRLQRLNPADPATLFSMGVIAVQLKRFDEGRAHFERLIELDKRTSDAAYYLGRMDQEAGRQASAERWYGEVTGGDFKLDAKIRLSELMIARGGIDEARELLDTLRQNEPDLSLRLYLVEAELLATVWSPDQVLGIYREALESHPEDPEILYARALYAASIDRIDILERDLLQVLTEDPENADALNALGYTLADKTDRLKEALEYIEQALALKPGVPAILDSMGWVHFRLGNYTLALTYLREAMEKQSDGEIAAHLGEVLWVTGARDEARRVWERALKLHPESEHLKEVMERLRE